MSEILTGALYVIGGVLGILITGLVFRGVGRVLKAGAREKQIRDAAEKAEGEVTDLTTLGPNELAKEVAKEAAHLDLAMRYALLKGVLIDVDLLDLEQPGYPNGRTQVRVRATGPDGVVRQWPP